VVGCCECGDEPSGSCATELISVLTMLIVVKNEFHIVLPIIINVTFTEKLRAH
jgi:hypothetical protein